jgi:hypothetical protein
MGRVLVLLLLAGLTGACSNSSTPRVEGPLEIDIPELCTRCVEVLTCEAKDRRVIYVLDEKSTWAQIATIWEYFAAFFTPKIEDFRDVTVYEMAAGDDVLSRNRGRARLDVWNRRVELPNAMVDQQTGDWFTADGQELGSCVHLPRRQDRQMAEKLASQP